MLGAICAFFPSPELFSFTSLYSSLLSAVLGQGVPVLNCRSAVLSAGDKPALKKQPQQSSAQKHGESAVTHPFPPLGPAVILLCPPAPS